MKVTSTGSHHSQNVKNKKTEKSDAAEKLDFSSDKPDKKISTANLNESSEVALSERARDIKKAREVAKSSSPDIDEAKVAKFQKLIDSGQYKVDANKVADKLVDEHLMTSLADNE